MNEKVWLKYCYRLLDSYQDVSMWLAAFLLAVLAKQLPSSVYRQLPLLKDFFFFFLISEEKKVDTLDQPLVVVC